jgi:peptidyl-prolyl cis-trans isomerase SurA
MKQSKCKRKQLARTLAPALIILGILSISSTGFAEVIEKIYAAVNGELITYTQLKNAEIELTQMLSQQYKDEELKQKIVEMKKNLLEQIIDQKMLTSFAREKNYNVDGEIELTIKEYKKQANIESDEEFKQAMAAQGVNYDEWRERLKENLMQRRYIYDSIGSKIKIDNSAIMEYYKKNMKDYTTPLKLSLNCIFLGKANNPSTDALQEKKKTIDTELANSKFEDTAKKYTELPGGEIFLGEFKQGELDPTLEKAAIDIKQGEHSGWIETNNGWYILQVVKRTEPQAMEYKAVRDEIENILVEEEQNKKLKDYMQELKKDSHIQIYENW